MRVIFTKNHHVHTGERSRRMYKRGREYEVSDEVGKSAIEAKRAKAVTDQSQSQKRSSPNG
jgi:hypothetical protein